MQMASTPWVFFFFVTDSMENLHVDIKIELNG